MDPYSGSNIEYLSFSLLSKILININIKINKKDPTTRRALKTKLFLRVS